MVAAVEVEGRAQMVPYSLLRNFEFLSHNDHLARVYGLKKIVLHSFVEDALAQIRNAFFHRNLHSSGSE